MSECHCLSRCQGRCFAYLVLLLSLKWQIDRGDKSGLNMPSFLLQRLDLNDVFTLIPWDFLQCKHYTYILYLLCSVDSSVQLCVASDSKSWPRRPSSDKSLLVLLACPTSRTNLVLVCPYFSFKLSVRAYLIVLSSVWPKMLSSCVDIILRL